MGHRDPSNALIGLGLFALLLAGMGTGSYLIASHTEEAMIDVVSKERLMEVSSHKDTGTRTTYRNFVYTRGEAYVVEDSLWNGHFSSATVYAKIQPNQRCAVVLSGYRLGFFSMFQNIIEAGCRPLKQGEQTQ